MKRVLLLGAIAIAACGGGDDGFNEEALRDFVRSVADQDAIAEDPGLIDELVESVRDTCEGDETEIGFTVAISLDENNGSTLAFMDVACPEKIPPEYLDDIPDLPRRG